MTPTDTDRFRGSGARPWQPLSGPALLDRLRFTGRRRPTVDPELVLRLRSGLERRLEAEGVHGDPSAPLVVTKARLAEAQDGVLAGLSGDRSGPAPTSALACGALVAVLFRQLVTVGTLGDPFVDGLAGLEVEGHHGELLAWIERMAPLDRAGLESEVARQAAGMQQRWPSLDARWLPRTRQRMRVPLLGGRVELSARVDLAIGRPAVSEATVALVDVRSGEHRPGHRCELHYSALVETLRTGAPPFVVATYSTRTGELDVEPVTEGMLESAAERSASATAMLFRSSRLDPPGRLTCPAPTRSVLPAIGSGVGPGSDVGGERRAA